MTRVQLEHIIRAAGAIADTEDLIVIGSQAVLGQLPDAPPELLVLNEADVFPRADPARSDLIDGSIGQDSPFQLSSVTAPTASTKPPRFSLMTGGHHPRQ